MVKAFKYLFKINNLIKKKKKKNHTNCFYCMTSYIIERTQRVLHIYIIYYIYKVRVYAVQSINDSGGVRSRRFSAKLSNEPTRSSTY